ncbi:hypothetical protein SAMN05216516_11134 [Izhakiella capsodis]|nr:hypothetical protein [Izhakiella capsodis]SFN58661.1 hypothetical protein SAMN05216516_11134 [Izhakiella capsodis]
MLDSAPPRVATSAPLNSTIRNHIVSMVALVRQLSGENSDNSTLNQHSRAIVMANHPAHFPFKFQYRSVPLSRADRQERLRQIILEATGEHQAAIVHRLMSPHPGNLIVADTNALTDLLSSSVSSTARYLNSMQIKQGIGHA